MLLFSLSCFFITLLHLNQRPKPATRLSFKRICDRSIASVHRKHRERGVVSGVRTGANPRPGVGPTVLSARWRRRSVSFASVCGCPADS